MGWIYALNEVREGLASTMLAPWTPPGGCKGSVVYAVENAYKGKIDMKLIFALKSMAGIRTPCPPWTKVKEKGRGMILSHSLVQASFGHMGGGRVELYVLM